jgi:bacteriorhodopsin
MLFFWLALKAFAVWIVGNVASSAYLLDLDWLITTPLTVVILTMYATRTKQVGRGRWGLAIGLCTMMVGGGMLAKQDWLGLRWFWFGSAGVAMVIILVALLRLRVANTHYWWIYGFNSVMWAAFPLIWVLGPNGLGKFNMDMETRLFTGFDLVAKMGLFLIILISVRGGIRRDLQLHSKY